MRTCSVNNQFLVEPSCCKSVTEAKVLLSKFGFSTGRYIVCLPEAWKKVLKVRFSGESEIEKLRLSRLLQKAKEQKSLIVHSRAFWDDQQSWLTNADAYFTSSKRIDAIVVDHEAAAQQSSHLTMDQLLDMPPTAEERIDAIPDELARVTDVFLKLNTEVFLVDPFLNPCKHDVESVLQKLFTSLIVGQCRAVKIFARNKCDEPKNKTWDEVVTKLDGFLAQFFPPKELLVTYVLLNDKQNPEEMHGRYLFSNSGGIRIDDGFKRLPRGRRTDVAPISQSVLDDIWRTFVVEHQKLHVAYEYSRKFDGSAWAMVSR